MLNKGVIAEGLGLEYPIFQGGMAWVADADLAAAVSNAGGLGILGTANADENFVRQQVQKIKTLTDKPYGVNVMLMNPRVDEIAKVLVEEQVPIITTGAGNSTKYMKMWNEAGAKVIPVVPSVAFAKLAERSGAFAVVAEGTESGGHVGELTTMTLVPQVVDAVSIPVIAAGGIGDGRGIAAAFAMGAQGVQLGTRFVIAKESNVHQNYKNKILKANDTATMVTGRRLGHPVRQIKNKFSRAYAKIEYTDIPDDELEVYAAGKLRKAVFEGDENDGCFLSGQIAGMLTKEQTCKEILEDLWQDAERVLGEMNKWVK